MTVSRRFPAEAPDIPGDAMLCDVEALYVYDGTVEEAAQAVGAAIGARLELRDSSFYGGDYYRVRDGLDGVILLENYEDDDEPFFKTEPVGSTCVQVTGFVAARDRLAGVPGLRAAGAP